MTGGPYYREHMPEGAVKIRVYDQSAHIFAGSQVIGLPHGAVLIIPREAAAPGSMAIAREYRPNGDVINHPDIPLVK